MNPFSRSQLNGGFGAETEPYRDDSYTLTFRPTPTFTSTKRNVRFTSTPAVRARDHATSEQSSLLFLCSINFPAPMPDKR